MYKTEPRKFNFSILAKISAELGFAGACALIWKPRKRNNSINRVEREYILNCKED